MLRLRLILLAVVLALLSTPATAQNPGALTFTDNVTALADAATLANYRRLGTATIEVSGTFTGTLTFEVQGTTWGAPIPGCLDAANAFVTTTTAAGKFVCPVAGWAGIRARASAWTSGTAVVRIGYGDGGLIH